MYSKKLRERGKMLGVKKNNEAENKVKGKGNKRRVE